MDLKIFVMFLVGTFLGALTYLADMFQKEYLMGMSKFQKIIYVLSFSFVCGMMFLVIAFGLNDILNFSFKVIVYTFNMNKDLLNEPIKLHDAVIYGVAGTVAAFIIKIRDWIDLFVEKKRGVR
ncbi:hypothetical protein ACNSOO_04755 [Aliarcobacter lanthieri]|uniref:hypothetical protein n=1 Tax=Aliarcobacter lanthieri TaxID=1355374 RepID=UPI003AABD776